MGVTSLSDTLICPFRYKPANLNETSFVNGKYSQKALEFVTVSYN